MKNFFSSEKNAPFDTKQQLEDTNMLLSSMQPVLEKVHSNKAFVMMSKGFDWIEEYLYYLIAIASIIFIFIMGNIFPFHVLSEIVSKPSVRQQFLTTSDLDTFAFAVKGLFGLIALLFVFLGIKKRTIRKSKDLLYLSSSELKKVETYLLNKQKTLSQFDTVSEFPPIEKETKENTENI